MMTEHEDLRNQQSGVGATAEALLEPLEPLIAYYAARWASCLAG